MRMERNLLKIDVPYLEQLANQIRNRLQEIQRDIYELAGKEFNIGSSQQLGKILFEELGYTYPERRKTASGQYMTDTATLEKIMDTYPVVNLIIEYRGLDKAQGTYVANLLKNHDEDGFIKLGFNQSGTDTGRFSSPGGKGINVDGYCGINIQSIPSNYAEGAPDIRKALRARPGNKLAALDYSGEELRIATNLSRESKWMDEFLHGEGDLHTATGRAIFGRHEITKAETQLAKTTNFLTLYGGGARTLSAQAKISEREAKRILVAFFAGLPTLKKWIDMERAKARKLGYAKTVFGRIRPLQRFYETGRDGDIAHADRAAVNFLVQGAGADIMKTAMVRVQNWISGQNLQDVIKLLITMHDEIVFELPEDKMPLYIPRLNSIMKLEDILQNPKWLNWPVPLRIDAEYGDSWHVDHDFFKENPDLEALDPIEFHSPSQIVEGDSIDTADQAPALVSVPRDVEKEEPSEAPPEKEEEISGEQEKVDIKPESELDSKISEEQEQVVPQVVPNAQQASEGGLTEISEGIQDSLTTPETMIYTIQWRTASTLSRLNEIIRFISSESRSKAGYKGPIKNLQIRDREGNMLLVADCKVRADAFLALARYHNL